MATNAPSATSEHMARFIQRRGQIKGALTRLSNYINDEQNHGAENIVAIRLRSEKVAALWDQFDQIQGELERLQNMGEDSSQTERIAFEEVYFQTLSRVNEIISSISPSNQSINATNHVENDGDASPNARRTNQIKLPQIQLPKFDGQYDKWMSFHDSFTSLIHNNAELSIIQKFQYLKAVLTCEASNVIESIEITSDNYIVAWRLLTDRYHNKRFIIRNHIRDLFELETEKRNSPMSLRRLLDDVQRHLRSLKALQQPTEHWDLLLVHLITAKLEQQSLYHWETQCAADNADTLPTLEALLGFLKKRCRASESLVSQSSFQNNFGPNASVQRPKSQKICLPIATNNRGNNTSSCPKCGGRHMLYKCVSFKKLSLAQKSKVIADKRLCVQCMSSHDGRDCKFHACYICKAPHHHLLHDGNAPSSATSASNDNSPPFAITEAVDGVSKMALVSAVHADVLLSTIMLHIHSAAGDKIPCRALLDSGAQSNFISYELCRKLNLNPRSVSVPIYGIGQMKLNIKHTVRATIESIEESTIKSKLDFLVLDNMVGIMPSASLNKSTLKIPPHIKLADPNFNLPGRVDILLGAEIFYHALTEGQIRLPCGPILQNTYYGWIISGPIQSSVGYGKHCLFAGNHILSTDNSSNENLNNSLTRFWELNEIQSPVELSPEDRYCEELYAHTTIRDFDGRYSVHLPLRENHISLGESYHSALRRFLLLEKRLNANVELAKQYNQFVDEYLSLGHMSLCVGDDYNKNYVPFYLPHHAVIKNSSTTTKLRVVFDGSAKTSTGVSLNDVLYTGPNLQRDIFEVLLRFRRHIIALVADVEKMYRQINIDPKFRNFHRILWRPTRNSDVKTYTLNTVTYGTGCAAYLAIKSLKQIAIDGGADFPKAQRVIQNDFYVDDLLTGANSYEDAVLLVHQLNGILQSGGFRLRKWSSSHTLLRSKILVHNLTDKLTLHDACHSQKTLGMIWDAGRDTFRFDCSNITAGSIISKRSILSTIAGLYDPLGLLGPVILMAKLLIQKLWRLKFDWDDGLPSSIREEWLRLFRDLPSLNEFHIPRGITEIQRPVYQLHGFCDASEVAYGACIYIGSICGNKSETRLLGSRSRVAPLKTITLPRLELCGAMLLASLFVKVKTCIDLPIESSWLWTDSMIVLGWLGNGSHLFKTFVGNRISEIQRISNMSDWHHVRSNDNPADCLSRGLLPCELVVSKLWWYGPLWLTDCSSPLPSSTVPAFDPQQLLETKRILVVVEGSSFYSNLFMQYSSFNQLVRIFAYLFRFINNSLGSRVHLKGSLTMCELNQSTGHIIGVLQSIEFPSEIQAISSNKQLHHGSRLATLNPFLDDSGLIRVGGRLRNSDLPYPTKHPLLLPSGHVITKLIMRETHNLNLHAPPQLLLSLVRRKYWPINGKSTAREVCRSCIQCFRSNPQIKHTQIMGDLPTDRVTPSRPFNTCGVDYCGPLLFVQ